MDNIQTTEEEAIKLKLLKEQADTLNIKYHPNIGLEKIQEKITNYLQNLNKNIKSEPEEQTKAQKMTDLRRKATRLQRVSVTCMNPDKRNWKGDYFRIANRVIGTVTKFIPFDGRPFHVPTVLLKMLENKKFQQFNNVEVKNGKFIVKSSLVPEYAISYLPPLTAEEIDKLKKEQAYMDSVPQGELV